MWRDPAPMLLAAAALSAIAWAAYRLDKLCARRQWRRIPERTLLLLTLVGGTGALLGMYAHRQRHKCNKPVFVATAVLATLLQLAALAYLGYLFATAPRA